MERLDLPTKYDVEKESMENLFIKVSTSILKAEDNTDYTEVLNKLLSQGYSLYDISASLLRMVNESSKNIKITELDKVDFGKKFEMNESNRKDSGNGNAKGKKNKEIKKIKGPKIFINKGKRDGLDSREIIRLVDKYTNVSPKEIGKINIMPSFTFVEIPKNMIKDAIRDLDGKKIKGKSLKAEYSEK